MKFLPERRAITGFGDGGFRFGDHSHRGALLILPSGIYPWDGEDVAPIIAEQVEIDFVIVGQGVSCSSDAASIKNLRAGGINFEVMSTSAAVHTYNLMFDEGRRVAAAFSAVS